jgi:hypothetical protein
MSFGYGVGDIITVTTLALKAIQNTRQACGQYDELTREVTSLHIVLSRLQHEAENPSSLLLHLSVDEKEELNHILKSCDEILKILNAILEKYGTLGDGGRSATKLWQRVRFGNGEMQDLNNIRNQLSSQTASLALFLHLVALGSQGRVERQMVRQMGALQDLQRSIDVTTSTVPTVGNRESSILTTYENDDKDFWKEFRRELIAQGCSSEMMAKHRALIVDYIKELDLNDDPESKLDIQSVYSLDPITLEAASTESFGFDDEVVNSRIYTRVLAGAAVRNSALYAPTLFTPPAEPADWPLTATEPPQNTLVSGRVEPPETNSSDSEYEPSASALHNLQLEPMNDSLNVFSGPGQSKSPSFAHELLSTSQLRTEARLKTLRQPTTPKMLEASITIKQAKHSRSLSNKAAPYRTGATKFLEQHNLVVIGGCGVDKSALTYQVTPLNPIT